MKYYMTTTEFNCGIDLHSKQMYVCIMDRQGRILVHCNIKGNAILASKLARAVYYMLQTGTVFDAERVVATSI